MKNFSLIVLALLVLCGCDLTTRNHPNPYIPIPLSTKAAQMVQGDNAFALELLKQVQSTLIGYNQWMV